MKQSTALKEKSDARPMAATYDQNINQKLSKSRNIGRRGLDFEVAQTSRNHELGEDKKLRIREKVSKIKKNTAQNVTKDTNHEEIERVVDKNDQEATDEFEEADKGISRFGELRKKKLRKPFN